MAISFQKLYDKMCLREDFSDTRAMEAIRTGHNIREDFWDDFISVTNNAEALAELLGVRTDQVTGWAARIRDAIDKVGSADREEPDKDKINDKMIPTGEIASDMDKFDTADTRPMP